ncbi:MAG: 3-deoxy-D-manno-octulosonic acid transferase [Ignavibacteriales bacterium]|nr:3-deoxy-D-manno-octulosonic acid transferase [Ignavibacteriota bacterium]MCB9249771.1 3-deoxy-D-manno-octulosonic acid transferase [Ignavibacteriales bacterium]
MKSVWFYIYNIIALPLLKIGLYFLSLFDKKIRTGIKGRMRLFENLILNLTDLDRSKKLIWIHSSSLGEFEQAKPIIEQIKRNIDINILVTFFSPSGYNNSIKYPHADIISYLPFDSVRNAKRFVGLVKPSAVLFMRYDFWPNFIWVLSQYKVAMFIVDATMSDKSKRKLPIAKQFHTDLFNNFLRILTVSEKDKEGFRDFNIPEEKLAVVGDTRFDRVYQKSINAKSKSLFKSNLFEGKKVFVLGSTWEADEEIILPAILKLIKNDEDVVIIIVPHEPSMERLEELENTLKGNSTIRFSYMNNYKDEKLILVDSIGILLTLYYYADVAYVGGSFKQGIHNVLEPAVYGIPVIFGPKNKNSQEAQKMLKLGSGIEITNKTNAYKVFRELFSNEEKRKSLGNISNNYVKNNIGATQKIIYEFSIIGKR